MAKARNASGLGATSGLGWLAIAVGLALALIPLTASPALAADSDSTQAATESAAAPAKDATGAATPAEGATDAKAAAPAKDDATDAKAAAPVKDATKAKAGTEDLPGTYQLPLRAKAPKSTMPAPVSFAISGKKFLEGRALKAGEFTFHIALAGAAQIPAKSDLPDKLQPGSDLSDAEKYELVAHGGLVYHPSSTQPAPSSVYATNTADGDIVFPSLTFDGTAVGETATVRHLGVVFCYTIAERPPRNGNGELLDGVTRDDLGRYVYQGVTYDDAVKRVYLYVYQTTGADGSPALAVVPLGDATFSKKPGRTASGVGVGFRNVFRGTQIDAYDGVVYLEGQPITAGEFRFEVRKVSESGKVLDEQSVTCDGAENGTSGAEVPVIRDHVYDQAGRFFYTVRQTASDKSAPSGVRLDETSYVVTVEVAPNEDGDLQASITYVRKKAPGATRWTNVDVDAEPSPVVWSNSLVTAGVSGTGKPDAPSPDEPGEEGSGTDHPATGDGGATDQPAGGEPSGPASGTEGDAGSADAGAGAAEGTEPGAAEDAGAGADTGAAGDADGATGDSAGAGNAEAAGTQEKPKAGSNGSSDTAAPSRDGAKKASAQTPGAFAQTGDALGPVMLIVLLIIIASGVVLALAIRHRKSRS